MNYKVLMLKFMAVDYSEKVKYQIEQKLTSILKNKYGANVKIIFRGAEPYWKFPEQMKVYFAVKSDPLMSPKDMFLLLQPDGKATFSRLDMTWSNHYHGGVLITPEITWAHFYYFEDTYEEYSQA
jgi:uracil DNA glycosylase